MANNVVLGAAGCCCCLTIIFLIVMISTSIMVVEQTEWCLKYNWWSESVAEDPITQPGMKYIGMGNYLIRYPNTNKNVYFRKTGAVGVDEGDIRKGPIAVRTNDGLSVSLELEFTYRLRSERLRDLYMLVGEQQWFETIMFLSEGVIDNAATEFTAQEFYLNRTLIQSELTNRLREELDSKLYITLQTLQLQPAHFPDKYSNSIDETQTWNTDIEVAMQEQKTAIIKKETQLKTSRELAARLVVQANASAQEVTLNNQAEVTQFIYRQEKEAEGYQETLKFFAKENPSTAVDNLLNYMKVRALADHQDAKKTFKLQS